MATAIPVCRTARQAKRAGPKLEAGPEASAERSEGTMEARRGRDSRSEARCAARQRDRPCFLAGDARLSYDPSMEETIINNDDRLEHMLHRSNALHERLDELLGDADFDGSPRGESALGMCLVAMEHATAMRALMALRLPSSAVGLMRLQFEALTRAMWLLYAASDAAIDKLLAPLTLQNEQAAKNLPGASEMIEQIGKRVGQGAPAAAHQMLSHFKDVTWHGMNSFVHGGIHPLRRSADGFPVDLALQVLRSSNGLTTMNGMTMAVLTGDEAVAKPVSKIQPAFADCLPDLLKP